MLEKIKNYVLSKPGKICLGILLGFVAVNLLIYGVFAGRTYPNTQVGKFSAGTTDYSSLPHKLNNFHLLPMTISSQGKGKDFSVPSAKLGVTVDSSTMVHAAHARSWLPVANFFVAHNLPSRFKVNQTALKRELSEITPNDQQAPADAQIVVQNNQFILVNSKPGYQLNASQAIKLISSKVAQGETSIKLPFVIVQPKVSDTSLEPDLQQLRAEQGVALSFTYNGNTTNVPAATIASWYADVNGQFAVQPSRIQAYINQVGATNNIHVKNLSDLVSQTQTDLQKVSPATLALVAVPTTICSPNSLNQFIIVSISQRHMWACSTYNQVYDSPVVTGMENLPADLTPTGTYKIASKQTGLFLNGSDSTGSWHEFVNYWMPFLTNQYGVYGFHDATWRSDSDFGNIDPSSSNASHGCVELPLATAKWLYGWAARGTSVNITN